MTTAAHDPGLAGAVAPSGRLEVAINLGNAVLAQVGADGRPAGITVDLALHLAALLGLEVSLRSFETAAHVVGALEDGTCDMGFLARDPRRADVIAFTQPYVVIEGAYIVRNGSSFMAPGDLDRPGLRIAVGAGAAYDLHLSRTIRHAELVRYPTSALALAGFHEDGLDAGANIRQPAAAFAARHHGLRLLPEPFMQIHQAIAFPRGRGRARDWADAVLAELKAGGAVAQLLERHGQGDLMVPE